MLMIPSIGERMAARWRLRDIAEPERWTARKLSLASGLAYNTVWGLWTNKSKRADLDTLTTLARVLKVHPRDLIGDTDEQVQPAEGAA